MIYDYEINGLPVKTGDIICTTDGGAPVAAGEFWRLVGKFVPGDVDHVAVYVGPEGRCVEAGAKGRVITYEVKNRVWDGLKMKDDRNVIDTLYGIAYPLADKGFPEQKESGIRQAVADYCLAQAAAGKPYNLNFFNSKTEEAFYCSQLAYLAYLKHGIDLNTNQGVPDIRGTESIIYPQEIWRGCVNKRCDAGGQRPGGIGVWLSRVGRAIRSWLGRRG